MATQRVEDFNGWFEVARNPISKVGVFPYLGSSLGEDVIKEQGLDPEAVYQVLRPAEELAKPEFLFSCSLLPWINDHTMLGGEDTGYVRPEEKGIGGVTGEQVVFDETDETVYSNIKLFSEAHKNEVENGKRELSLGYRCVYVWAPGEYKGQKYDLIQRNLRGNHLASVDEGRMGSAVAVLDHNDIKGASAMDELLKLLEAMVAQVKKMKEEGDGEKPAVDPEAVIVEDEDDAAAKDEEVKATDEEVKTEAKDEEVKATDEEVKTEATDEDDLEKADKPVTAAAMDAAVETRVMKQFKALQAGEVLAKKLKPHVGAFDHSGKTELQIAQYGIKKLGLTVDKGEEVPSLKGWLTAKGDPSKQQTVRNGMATGQDAADTAKPSLMAKKLAERGNA